jgi:hypothetical protein
MLGTTWQLSIVSLDEREALQYKLIIHLFEIAESKPSSGRHLYSTPLLIRMD